MNVTGRLHQRPFLPRTLVKSMAIVGMTFFDVFVWLLGQQTGR